MTQRILCVSSYGNGLVTNREVFWFLFGPQDPMNSALSVRPSVLNAVFSELTHYFFLILCMNLEILNMRKVTEPDFSEKFSFAQKRAKMA